MLFGKKEEATAQRRSGSGKDEEKCSVSGCKDPVVRSISMKKVKSALSSVDDSQRRAHLCKAHYKEYKKKTKGDRELERLGWE